jgi:DNA-binding transcriptional ArsR family regulator
VAVVLKLGGFDPADFHVAVSPLSEMVALLHALAEPDHHLEARAALEDISATLTPGYLADFRTLAPLWARFRCRVFFPSEARSLGLDEELERIAEMPLEQFVRLVAEGVQGSIRRVPPVPELLADTPGREDFLSYCRARSSIRRELAELLLDDPEGFRVRLLDFLRATREAFFGREWAHVHDTIRRSAALTRTRLQHADPVTVMAQLSPSARHVPELHEIRFDKLQQSSVELRGRSVIAVPSVRIGPHLTIKDDAGLPVVIHYAVHAAEQTPLEIRTIRERLAALASESRMELFRHLSAEPITTSELSQRLNQSPAQISRSLGVLRDADLLVSERRGKLVYHRVNMDRVINLGPDILSTLLR